MLDNSYKKSMLYHAVCRLRKQMDHSIIKMIMALKRHHIVKETGIDSLEAMIRKILNKDIE
ncbi:MAG: hypothetical protein V1844_25490 [Pseudomonadota bacterium]